ncbi:MAG: hypothetical protein R3B09_03045 [Nannocystaceae bacterium]
MHTVPLTPPRTSPRPPPPPPPRRRRSSRVDFTVLAALLDGPRRGPSSPPRVRTPVAFADTIRPEAMLVRRDGERDGDGEIKLCARLVARRIVPAGPPPALPRIPAPRDPERSRAAASPPRPTHEPAIIGQEEALRRLDAAMDRARGGAGAALLLRGGGDTTAATLARRALAGLAPAGSSRALVSLTAVGLERSGVPFQMIAALVASLAEHLSGLPSAPRAAALAGGVACLARLFPSMEAFTPATPGVALPVLSAGCRRRAMVELRSILGSIGALRPVAILLEDLHLGDADSAELLDRLLAGGPPRGVVVVATLRAGAEEMAALPRTLESFEAVPIAALPHEEAILYARRRLRAHESASLDLAPAIAAASGKRPTLIDLLARLLARRSAAGALRPSTATMDRLLEAVLEDMSAVDRTVCELIAVDGAPIFHELLDRAAGQRTSYSLDRLAAAGLCAPSEDRAAVRIAHAQVAESIVRLVPEARRRSHRRALADAHRRCARGDLARAAYHNLGADAWQEAGELAHEAAHLAKQASAHGLAADLYELALCTDPRSRPLRLRLAEVQASAGRFEVAANNRLRVALAARTSQRLELAAQACELLFLAGRRDRGQRTAAMILEEVAVEVLGDEPRRRAVLLAELAALGGHPLEFREQSRCELGGDLLRRLEVCLRMARLLLLDDPLGAGILAARGAQLALLAGDPRLVATALALTGRAAVEHDPALAGRLLARADELARAHGDAYGGVIVALCRGLALLDEDRARARHHLDACIAAAEALGEEARWEQQLAVAARARALAA